MQRLGLILLSTILSFLFPARNVHDSYASTPITREPPHAHVEQPPERPIHRSTGESVRGVFLTASSVGNPALLHHTLARLLERGGNAVIFDAKGSAVHFDATDVPIAEAYGMVNPSYRLRDVVEVLHEHGVRAIARYIAIKDVGGLTEQMPGTQLRHPKTGAILSHGWADPDHPVTLAYNREILCALARSGVDEINLDYIRYDTKRAGRISVLPADDRLEKIETFVRMARETIDRCGRGVHLSVSTFAILGWDHDTNAPTIGQDLRRIAPLVDVIAPMPYPATFSEYYGGGLGDGERIQYLMRETLRGYARVLGPDHAEKLRPWLQGFNITDGGVRRQIQGALDAGVCGFTVWNADNDYGVFYEALTGILPSCPESSSIASGTP